MLLVEPVVIRPLLVEWEAEKTEIAAELERAEAAKWCALVDIRPHGRSGPMLREYTITCIASILA